MDFEFCYSDSNVNWSDLCELYRAAPLGEKNEKDLRTVFSNSMFKCFVYAYGKLVGVGRALADGKDCSYICDIAVHPKCQGTGLGKKIVQYLVDVSKGHKKIILYAKPGKEGFYSKLGFKRMNTAMAIFEDEKNMIKNGTISDS